MSQTPKKKVLKNKKGGLERQKHLLTQKLSLYPGRSSRRPYRGAQIDNLFNDFKP